MPGPAPKRESERRRRNKRARPTEHIDGAVPPPELDIESVHPIAADLYESLKASPEAAYATPAAWQRARLMVHVLSKQLLRPEGVSAVMYTAIQQDLKALLVDPAELRRLSIEVRKAPSTDPDEDAAVAHLDDFRSRTS